MAADLMTLIRQADEALELAVKAMQNGYVFVPPHEADKIMEARRALRQAAAYGVGVRRAVEVTDAGVPVRWNGEGRAVRAEVFAVPSTCRADPGECAHNGACMYACGVGMPRPGQEKNHG